MRHNAESLVTQKVLAHHHQTQEKKTEKVMTDRPDVDVVMKVGVLVN
jgi:hypothetical protein